jgi:hypothetical protein
MGRIRLGLRLAGASWRVVRQEKSLVAFPLLSALFAILYTVLIVGPLGLVGYLALGDTGVLAYALLAVMLFGTSVGATFFGVAAAANASRVFDGEDPKLGDGIAVARSRFGVIVKWALVSATVGLLLQIIADRLGGLGGAIVQGLGGLAWSVASFFALPILALEGLGPFAVLKRSTGVIKERWGEALTGTIGIGLVTGLISFAGIAVIALGVWAGVSGSWAAGAPLMAVGFLVFIVGLTMGAVLRAVFSVAVYRFATEGRALGPYSEDDLKQAFRARTGRI